MISKLKKSFPIFCFAILIFAALGYGEEKKNDLFAPVYSRTPAVVPLKDALSRVIEFPFKLIKWPMDAGIIYTEQHRLDKKTKWIYEQSLKYGVKPRFGTLDVTAIPYYGAELNLLTLARQQEKYPDLFATTTILHSPSIFFQVGSEIGAQRIGGTGFHTKGIFDYNRLEEEPFYGIGPHTSMGDGTSYRMETTKVGGAVGYEFSPTLDLVSEFDYRKVNILNRAHHGKGDILTIFAGQDIPGVHGDDLLDYSLAFLRYKGDSKDEATQGSYQKLLVQFTDGVNDSSTSYFKYRLDAAKYFRLASPRRILAARLVAEYNEEINHSKVPFFDMAKLGGAGFGPRCSDTERGFVYNRFYGETSLLLNLEYRYTVLEYREFKVKTAFFSDTGQAFARISKFQFKDFRESYGVGFYISYSRNTLLNFSVAHSNEGTRFYIKNKLAF